nr:Inner membrane protein yccF [Klebsiella pneumoniae]
MRTILNILNFILGGFATTLGWLLATGQHHSDCHAAADSFLLEITRLSLFPYGNEAIHVDELEPGRKTVY